MDKSRIKTRNFSSQGKLWTTNCIQTGVKLEIKRRHHIDKTFKVKHWNIVYHSTRQRLQLRLPTKLYNVLVHRLIVYLRHKPRTEKLNSEPTVSPDKLRTSTDWQISLSVRLKSEYLPTSNCCIPKNIQWFSLNSSSFKYEIPKEKSHQAGDFMY